MPLCVIAAYYNPAGYKNKRALYQAFRTALDAQNVPVLTVEQALGEADFDLEDSPDVLKVRGGDPLFQTERLFNLALRQVDPRYDAIAWVDADVLFENPDWAEHTQRLLREKYVVVQPFETAIWLDQGSLCPADGIDRQRRGFGSVYVENPSRVLRRYDGHTGFAWAMRRSVLDSIGFYDAVPLGGSDTLMAQAFVGGKDAPASKFIAGVTPQAYAHFCRWADRAYARVAGRLGFLPGSVWHLWHGSKPNRYYEERNSWMKQLGFDPEEHLVLDESGLWRWSDSAARLRELAQAYFSARDEEGAGVNNLALPSGLTLQSPG